MFAYGKLINLFHYISNEFKIDHASLLSLRYILDVQKGTS